MVTLTLLPLLLALALRLVPAAALPGPSRAIGGTNPLRRLRPVRARPPQSADPV